MLSPMRLEFYFDFSCPYAYLGATQIERLAERAGADLVWRPMLLGGVFRDIGHATSPMRQMSPAKTRHNAKDMLRWADVFDVPLQIPVGHPMRTVRALRALLSLPQSAWPRVIHAVYRAYWQDGRNVADESVLREVLAGADVTGDELDGAMAAGDDDGIKSELRTRTDEAVSRGVFGAPTMFVHAGDGDPLMFWGQDRLHMVEAALTGWRPDHEQRGDHPPNASDLQALGEDLRDAAATPPAVEFWYDFSSPFSYLGSTQIDAIAARTGATVTWRPMLLGAVFKQLGTPNVPMLAVPEPKRRYYARELEYWASRWEVPFRFTSRFPMRTVTALRLALLAGDRGPALSQAIYRALWVDDRDISDQAVLADILGAYDFDADDMLRRTQDPAIKAQLIANTTEAIERGVFGAPTCIVSDPAGELLFWGQDRLALVERALRGWRPRAE